MIAVGMECVSLHYNNVRAIQAGKALGAKFHIAPGEEIVVTMEHVMERIMTPQCALTVTTLTLVKDASDDVLTGV